MTEKPVGVRWTVGDVSARGFEALRLSIWGAWRIFGPDAAYAVCVNTIPVREAQSRVGPALPEPVAWHDSTPDVPGFIRSRLDTRMAEGVGWKFAPLRLFPDRWEIALDNDCILWDRPEALDRWLTRAAPNRCLMARDVRVCLGQFEDCCAGRAINSGIRGLPPRFNYGAVLRETLRDRELMLGRRVVMSSETDEQGLQAAAVSRLEPPELVAIEDVTICSPFHPHLPHLGHCGAHFVGLNARHIPWDYYDRPADEWMAQHWERQRAALYAKVGLDTEAELCAHS